MTTKQYYKLAYRYERIWQQNTEFNAGKNRAKSLESIPATIPYWILTNAKTSYFIGKYR